MILLHANNEHLMMLKLLPFIFITFHGALSMINGLYADRNDFPFVVAIFKYNLYHCSGILINEFNVITAGHCVEMILTDADLSVVVGYVVVPKRLEGSASDIYMVKEVYHYPQFARNGRVRGNETFFFHDIAVLRIYPQVRLTEFIGFASLMHTEAPWGPLTDCSIISWSPLSNYMKLMWDKVKYVSDEVSYMWGTHLSANQKGFNDLFEHDAISSDDIGSPIVCNNQVIGIVVKGGQHDQRGKPSTLLLIYNYIEFIWEVVTEGLFDIHPWKFPYIATVWNVRVPQCGGFIVDETHIVTTAFCARNISPMSGRVTVGHTTVYLNDPDLKWLSIKKIVEHPYCHVHHHTWPVRMSPNDIAVITLTAPLVWSPDIAPLTISETENVAGGQVCQVLRWTRYPGSAQRKLQRLTLKRSVVIIWDSSQLECLIKTQEVTSFWGKTPYVMPISSLIDGGNPIICNGYPVGMVLQDSRPKKWNGPNSARFLKLRPYLPFINSVINRT